jgi:hypothetical protein
MWRRRFRSRLGLPNLHAGSAARHGDRARRSGSALIGVAVVLGSVLAGGGDPAQATTVKPAITNYDASPDTLAYTGGTVTVSATVMGASECTFSSATPGISGLPTTVACDSGSASTIVVVATNTSEKVHHLLVKLTALGPQAQTTATTIITIDEAPPLPTITHFASTPDPVPFTGGTATVSATVNNATQCTFSSTSPVIAGLPTTVPCNSGSASTVVSLTANATIRPMKVLVSVTAVGPVRSVVIRRFITVGPAPPPAISSYISNPSPVSWTGGSVTLSADVANATTCTFSAAGHAIRTVSGLPATVPCTSGNASVNVTVNANHRRHTASYMVKLTATGSGTNVTVTTDITVSPITTPPTISGFVSDPLPVGSAGGAATLSADVTNAVSCTFSSKSAAVSGLPVTVPCSVGAVSTTVTVPANTRSRLQSYRIKLTVHGQRKRTTATTDVSVAGQGHS